MISLILILSTFGVLAFDIGEYEYLGDNFSTSGQSASITSVVLSSNGLHAYALSGSGVLYHYALSTEFLLSSASYVESKSIDSYTRGQLFFVDSNNLLISAYQTTPSQASWIAQYHMSNYNISGLYSVGSLSLSDVDDGYNTGFYTLDYSGTKLFYSSQNLTVQNKSIYLFETSLPYNISNFTLTGSVLTSLENGKRIIFADYGNYYIEGTTTPTQYNLSVPYDITTRVFSKNGSLPITFSSSLDLLFADEYLVYFNNVNGELYKLQPVGPVGQIASILSFDLAYNSIDSRSMNNYFTDYNKLEIVFYDTFQNNTVNLTTTKGGVNYSLYETAYFDLEVNTTLNNINIIASSYLTNFSIPLNLTLSRGSKNLFVTDPLYFNVNDTITPVVQIAEFVPVTLGFNSSDYRVFSNYFTNYNKITLGYYDYCDFQSIELSATIGGVTNSIDTTCYKIVLTPSVNDIKVTFFSYEFNHSTSITIKAENDYGYIYALNPLIFNISSVYASGVISTETAEGGGVVSDFLTGLFPDSEGLNNGEKLLRVMATLILTVIVLVLLGMEGGGLKILSFIGSGIIIIELFYFTFIGYLPAMVLIALALVSGGIIFFLFKSKGGG